MSDAAIILLMLAGVAAGCLIGVGAALRIVQRARRADEDEREVTRRWIEEGRP
jgi:hypothetical protein